LNSINPKDPKLTSKTSRATRFGVRFEPDWAPEELPEFSRWAEQAGFDELWFSEDVPWAGGMAMAATVLATTEGLGVGIGCLPAITRNVATTAMEVAALARLGPGRVTIALSHGVPAWMDQIGAHVTNRLIALEETTSTLRALLAGEKVTMAGEHVTLNEFELGFPPIEVPPILLGTTGPRGLKIAGRSSDGIVLAEVSTPEAVRWARNEMMSEGDAGTTVVFAMASINEDRGSALAEVRPRIQRLVDFEIFPRLIEIAGLNANDGRELTDSVLGSLAAAGSPDDCAATVAGWINAQVDRIVLVAGADDPKATYARFASEVLPRFR